MTCKKRIEQLERALRVHDLRAECQRQHRHPTNKELSEYLPDMARLGLINEKTSAEGVAHLFFYLPKGIREEALAVKPEEVACCGND